MVEKQEIGRTILTLSTLSALAIFLVSAGLLCHSLYEYRKGKKEYGELRQYTAKASGQEPDPQSPGSLPTGGREPILTVDFKVLKRPNPHIITWIHIPGTPVNCPVTQGGDSSYCLTRTFSGVYNGAEYIFMDYRSSLPSEGGNMVLYRHNMKNGSMSGSLKRYWGDEYYREHASFCLYTAKGDNFLYHITDRRKISAQTDFSSNVRDKEEGTGESGKADESSKADQDVEVILVTCVAGRNEERLTIKVDAKRIE